MGLYDIWTHGHSMQIEYPERIESVKRRGDSISVTAKNGSHNWFHFAIPTMSMYDDVAHPKIEYISIRFRMSSDMSIKAVHLYNCEERIITFDDLDITRDSAADHNPWFMETFTPNIDKRISYGLGISILVGFGIESFSHTIEFSGAGCRFLR